jgi:hypothetical protein
MQAFILRKTASGTLIHINLCWQYIAFQEYYKLSINWFLSNSHSKL